MRAKLILGATLVLLIVLAMLLRYVDLRADLTRTAHEEHLKVYKTLEAFATQAAQSNRLDLFRENMAALLALSPVVGGEITLHKHRYPLEMLLEKAMLNPRYWSVGEITLDANVGSIEKQGTTAFSFVFRNSPAPSHVNVRFQAHTASITRDMLVVFSFHDTFGTLSSDKETFEHKQLQHPDFTLETYLQKDDILPALTKEMRRFIVTLLAFIFATVLLLALYLTYAIKRPARKAIATLNGQISSVLEGNVSKEPQELASIKEMRELQHNTQKLIKHFFATLNELNVTRDMLQQKEISDELTGLPNKKKFEYDLKHMFVANKEGFIVYLKMDKIGLFTKNHGPQTVDALIENFAHVVKKYFNTHRDIDATIYRFFGGEFSILLYEKETKRVEAILKEIIDLTEKLSDKYYFFDNAIYYGATPFNAYASIESITQSAQDAFEVALKDTSKNYFVSDASHQLELNQKLEKTVQDIIARNDFVLQYLDDTYDFSLPPELLMQDVSPLLIDSYTFESIPSGTFMSVAEKLGLIADFEKALVNKVLEQIQLGDLSHSICITLSAGTYSHKPFLSWLGTLLASNPYAKQLIFSVPAYSITSNYNDFLNFSRFLHEYNGALLIQKYTLEDLSFEKLIPIEPHYLRLDKEYFQDFEKNTLKQRSVKKIILAIQNQQIRIVAHGVKDDRILDTLESYGFFGICR